MRKAVQFVTTIILLALSYSHTYAQVKVVRGEGAASVQGASPKGPSEMERNTALNAAKLMAWRSYLAMPGQNETVDQIRANERQFLDRLDELLVDVVTVEEAYNNDSKRYTIRIKASVAESVINSMIRTSSRASVKSQIPGGGGASASAGASIVVLGMAREADVVRSFSAKDTKVQQISSENSSSATKAEAAKGSKGNQISSSVRDSATSSTTTSATGGSREQKRDKISYKIGNVSVLNSKLPRILLQSGIKATQYAFLMRPCKLPNPDSFSKQYAASDQGELPADVLADIQERLQSCGRAKYWVFASMDAGSYKTDPNTGLNLVTVSVSVQLMDVETGEQVASASKDVSGRSGDQTDAMRVATENAVQAVGDIIAAQVADIGK